MDGNDLSHETVNKTEKAQKGLKNSIPREEA